MIGRNEFFESDGGEQGFVITVRAAHAASFNPECLFSIIDDQCLMRQYFNSLLGLVAWIFFIN